MIEWFSLFYLCGSLSQKMCWFCHLCRLLLICTSHCAFFVWKVKFFVHYRIKEKVLAHKYGYCVITRTSGLESTLWPSLPQKWLIFNFRFLLFHHFESAWYRCKILQITLFCEGFLPCSLMQGPPWGEKYNTNQPFKIIISVY